MSGSATRWWATAVRAVLGALSPTVEVVDGAASWELRPRFLAEVAQTDRSGSA